MYANINYSPNYVMTHTNCWQEKNMSITITPILIIIIALPIAWLISEFKTDKRSIRCSLGILAILSCFGVAWVTAQLVRLNYNAWYGSSSKSLIDSVIEKLEDKDIETTLQELKKLQEEYRPTYESKAHYNELIDKTVKRLKNRRNANNKDASNSDSATAKSE